MKKHSFTVRRIATNAVMAAIFVGLASFYFMIAGVKVTLEELPVVMSAIAFGPVDAAIVGFLGEFIDQMIHYGFTPTTLLWILPAVVRGLFIGLCIHALKKRFTTEEIFKGRKTVLVFVICAVSGVLVSVLNTFAFYIDSKLFEYYTYALIFGVFWIRIVIGITLSSVMAAVSIPVTLALKRLKLIK